MKLFSVLLMTALCATLAAASISHPGEAQPLKPLAEWLRQGGKESVIRARILAAMDLFARDMPVRERGFRHEGEKITHVCSISSLPGFTDLMFFAQLDESNGNASVWRTGIDGILVSTVRFSGGVVQRVPNEEFKRGFDFEKMIFTTKMRMGQGSGIRRQDPNG